MAKYQCSSAVQTDAVAMAQCDDVARQLFEAAAAMEKAFTDPEMAKALSPAEVSPISREPPSAARDTVTRFADADPKHTCRAVAPARAPRRRTVPR